MRLHEDNTLFRQAVVATAGLLNIPEISIEKDYWVAYALHTIQVSMLHVNRTLCDFVTRTIPWTI